MEIIDFGNDPGDALHAHGAHGASLVRIAHGSGDARVSVIHVAAGGEIGAHESDLDVLLVVVSGSGWVKGADGPHIEVDAGQAVHVERHTVHALGSAAGMTVMVVLVGSLALDLPA